MKTLLHVAGPSSSEKKNQENLEATAIIIPKHVLFLRCFFNTTENSLQLQDKEESNYILDVHYHCLAGELNKQYLPHTAVEVRAPSPARGEANIAGGCSLLSQGGRCMGRGHRMLWCSARASCGRVELLTCVETEAKKKSIIFQNREEEQTFN